MRLLGMLERACLPGSVAQVVLTPQTILRSPPDLSISKVSTTLASAPRQLLTLELSQKPVEVLQDNLPVYFWLVGVEV